MRTKIQAEACSNSPIFGVHLPQLWPSSGFKDFQLDSAEPSEPIGVTSDEYVPICVLQYMRDLG